MTSIAPPAAVPTIPMATPRWLRGHHCEIMLMAGAQHAAFTKPASPSGIAMVTYDVAKLVAQLKTAVRIAPTITHRRSPKASDKRP